LAPNFLISLVVKDVSKRYFIVSARFSILFLSIYQSAAHSHYLENTNTKSKKLETELKQFKSNYLLSCHSFSAFCCKWKSTKLNSANARTSMTNNEKTTNQEWIAQISYKSHSSFPSKENESNFLFPHPLFGEMWICHIYNRFFFTLHYM